MAGLRPPALPRSGLVQRRVSSMGVTGNVRLSSLKLDSPEARISRSIGELSRTPQRPSIIRPAPGRYVKVGIEEGFRSSSCLARLASCSFGRSKNLGDKRGGQGINIYFHTARETNVALTRTNELMIVAIAGLNCILHRFNRKAGEVRCSDFARTICHYVFESVK